MTLPQRITDRITPEPNTGCWLWSGGLTHNGYGKTTVNGRDVRAHRAVFEAMVGPIAPELQLDHLCRQRSCVNPDHLEPVTALENTRRSPLVGRSSKAGRKTVLSATCGRGHTYTAENTIRRADGQRACRACVCLRKRVYRARASAMK